jgi:hypothetical protein
MPSVYRFTPLIHFSLFESMDIGLLYWYLPSSLSKYTTSSRSTFSKARLQYRPMCFPLFVVRFDDVVAKESINVGYCTGTGTVLQKRFWLRSSSTRLSFIHLSLLFPLLPSQVSDKLSGPYIRTGICTIPTGTCTLHT